LEELTKSKKSTAAEAKKKQKDAKAEYI